LICAGFSFLISASLACVLPEQALPSDGEPFEVEAAKVGTGPKALVEES